MRKLLLFAVLLLLVAFIIFVFPGIDFSSDSHGSNDTTGEPRAPDVEEPDEPEPDIRAATLLTAGDIMGHEYQVLQARVNNPDGTITYNFLPSFEFVSPYLKEADLAVGNLETTLAGAERGISYYPRFNTPVELAANLKDAGFDMLITANNHAMDSGLSGLKATIENVRNAGLLNCGTYLSPEEQQVPLIVDLNGIKIASLAYTDSTNMIPVPQGHEYAVNYIPNRLADITPIVDEINRARQAGADIVTIYLHWGGMYNFYPENWQRDLAAKLAKSGADLIIGNHAHVIQPLEWLTVEEGERAGRKVLVVYSLGNFFTNQHLTTGVPSAHTKAGLMIEVEFQKDMDSGETLISDADFHITWVQRHRQHRILPAADVIADGREKYKLDESDYAKLLDSYNKMKEVVEAYGFSEGKPRK